MKSLPGDGVVRTQVRPRDQNEAVSRLTDAHRALLAKLASITEMIEQYRATVHLLERERMRVTTKLRLTGYRAPMGDGK